MVAAKDETGVKARKAVWMLLREYVQALAARFRRTPDEILRDAERKAGAPHPEQN
jgi:hypothetical protein